MKNRIYRWLYYCMSLLAGQAVCATPPPVAPKTAPYVQPGAPVFSDTIPLFREKFNLANPQLPLAEYRTVDTGQIQNVVVLAASRINRSVYSSAALEPGTGKIKTLQITWVPHRQADEKASRDLALHYMAALIRFFSPQLSEQDSTKKLESLLRAAKGKTTYFDAEGALRYVVAEREDKGLTLAVEPVRLMLDNS
ncbi:MULTISPECIES: DUF1454 family protein [Tatumella]|uniref:DUF1454 family protein n=1 Tax=Tatumella punctata TaxID=399969 RepID=A0ABW1VS86_9GAMM|nr:MULTISPECIES: DUF1454 family protein [unclassified Tatumella]MBS0856584.1 DUF1454 family protein [Tatumella sp. JGM16]MBS0877931.1 DUF1454 family protein [Tatumella sp. JGM82]MBS0891637.1 DUF1454 family protein [Tatumella sp. JGM94]MBS0893818.1 DUF1454 family protein [Tatumella sp. JGM130]MBS0902539.1 DUF1454 family protein [Tatumella sp. JGM100]